MIMMMMMTKGEANKAREKDDEAEHDQKKRRGRK
jgi:hypothetical protein